MNDMISALSINFPRIIGDIDGASCSKTRGQEIQSDFVKATVLGAQHSQGPIRVVASWDQDPDTEYDGRTYVGLDNNDGVWIFSLQHGKYWCEKELEGHPNHGPRGLVYEMKYCWAPVECMGDEFWDDMDVIVGALIGKLSTRTSVENDGFYPSMG